MKPAGIILRFIFCHRWQAGTASGIRARSHKDFAGFQVEAQGKSRTFFGSEDCSSPLWLSLLTFLIPQGAVARKSGGRGVACARIASYFLDFLVLFRQGKSTIKIQGKKHLKFVYGPDQSRKIMKYYEKEGGNFVLKKTKYYILGNTEKEVDNVTGETRTLNYISGKAILEQTSSGNNLYYLHKDYQGTTLAVTDASGNVTQRYAYDPWGRRRNPSTWANLTASEIAQQNFLFARGYTGHEHLDEFGLINMNGRLYDPLLGRMLSPDNYVQAPDNSQNFNRYSYAMNNPLVYTDPSGEFFLLPAMMIGAFINVTMQGWSGNAQSVGDFVLAFGVGAAAGAAGAGVATGVQTAMAGASFWAPFVGSAEGISTILGAGYTSSFFNGALAGGAGGFAGGFTLGMGNGILQNQNIGQASVSGLEAGGWGALSGGIVGGVSEGIDAALDGRNFFNGGLNTPEKLEILYDRALKQGIITPEEGAVGNVTIGRSSGLAHRTGGKPIFYDEYKYANGMEIRKQGMSDSKLVFTRRIVRKMWNGKYPLEAINHEVIHANDYFNVSWWGEPNAVELILNSRKLTRWLELNALKQNMQRSDWHVFKEYYQYWLNK
jgi:RHS repeat-associated protein